MLVWSLNIIPQVPLWVFSFGHFILQLFLALEHDKLKQKLEVCAKLLKDIYLLPESYKEEDCYKYLIKVA